MIQKGDPYERNPCAPRFEERTPEETSRKERCAGKAAWNLATKMFKLKANDKATFYSHVEIKALVLVSRNTEDRMFVVDSGASMHMLSKKDLCSGETDTLRRSRNTTLVMTENGEVQTNEEAQVHVHDLDLFVTVQLLDETPTIYRFVSFAQNTHTSGKNSENPRLTKDGNIITCTMDNFVPLVVPGLSSSPSSSSASTSKPTRQSNSSGEPETSSASVTTRSDNPACGKPMHTKSFAVDLRVIFRGRPWNSSHQLHVLRAPSILGCFPLHRARPPNSCHVGHDELARRSSQAQIHAIVPHAEEKWATAKVHVFSDSVLCYSKSS